MERKGEHLTLRIAQLKKAIRRKYRQFKEGTLETEQLLEKQYKPLISELRKGKLPDEIKQEPKDEPVSEEEEEEEEFKPNAYSSPNKTAVESSYFKPNDTVTQPSFLEEEETFGDTTPQQDVSSILSTADGRETASRYVESTFQHPLTRKYMKKMMTRDNTIDHLYGPRIDPETDQLMVGSEPLQFDDDGSIRIAKRTYHPTRGLYELLFKRMPDDSLYDVHDLHAYKDILIQTNAHKRGYLYKGNIVRNASTKYRQIIERLFPKRGKGLDVWKSAGARDVVHWDDPNELCQRLKVLVASAETGNTGHRNEIVNLVEELREANLISGSGNSRYRSLVK